MVTSTSLFSDFNSQKRPSDDPRLSPSGRTWEVIANRSFFSMSSTTWLSIKSKDEGERMKDEASLCPTSSFHPSSFILHPFRTYSFQQRIDARGVFFNSVPYEVKRGSMPQIQRKAKLLAHVRGGVLQRPQRFVVFLFVAGDGNVHARVAQVIRDANFRDRHRGQSRGFQFVTDDLRDFFAQGLRDAFGTMHVRTACGSGRALPFQRSTPTLSGPPATAGGSASEFSRRDLLDHVTLDLIAELDVVEVLEADTALEPFTHFRGVVFKSSQRGDASFPTDHAVADQPGACVAANDPVDDHAAGDGAHARHAEDFAHVGFAENLLFFDFLEHADHRGLNFFFDLVDDRVQPDIDAFLLREFVRARFTPRR